MQNISACQFSQVPRTHAQVNKFFTASVITISYNVGYNDNGDVEKEEESVQTK